MSLTVVKVERLQQKIAEQRAKMNTAIVKGFPQQSLEDSIAALYRALAEAQAAAARHQKN